MKPTYKKTFFAILRHIPFALVLMTLLYVNRGNRLFTPQNIFDFSPKQPILAAIFFLLLYAAKPLTFVMPIIALQIATAMFFPTFQALLINIIGIGISTSISYLLGQYFGKDRVKKMLSRYKKSDTLKKVDSDNEVFYVLIVRAIGLISMDITGMFFGSIKINFAKYLTGSVLGLIPAMLIGTFIGTTASDPDSPAFIFSIILKITFIVTSIQIYKRKFKKKRAQA